MSIPKVGSYIARKTIRPFNCKYFMPAVLALGIFVFVFSTYSLDKHAVLLESDSNKMEKFDAAQVLVLDYLMHSARIDSVDSSLHDSSQLAYSYAARISHGTQKEFNRADFSQLARRARATLISLLVTEDETAILPPLNHTDHTYGATATNNIRLAYRRLLPILSGQVFPFLSSTNSDIFAMLQTFKVQQLNSAGIAITCGTRQYYMAYHLILTLRNKFQIHLPIEIFYGGDADLHPLMVESFASLPNVHPVNLVSLFPSLSQSKTGGWNLKPYAILATTFRITIFMDADVLFFKSPLRLIAHSKFLETGNLYYHDRRNNEPRYLKGPAWFRGLLPLNQPSPSARDLGYLTGKTTHEMDSGVIVLDKSRPGVLVSLLLACAMNSAPPDGGRDELARWTYGDKESFWFANELLRVPFSFNQHYGSVLGKADKERSGNGYTLVCGVLLLQADEEEEPFFWNGGGVLDDRSAMKNFQFNDQLEKVGLDLDGAGTQWLVGHCLNRTDTQVRGLNPVEKSLLEEYKELYRNGSIREVEI